MQACAPVPSPPQPLATPHAPRADLRPPGTGLTGLPGTKVGVAVWLLCARLCAPAPAPTPLAWHAAVQAAAAVLAAAAAAGMAADKAATSGTARLPHSHPDL